MNPLYQNLVIVAIMVVFAAMEWLSRRYRDTVHASANDTKLELFMFLSLIVVAQPFTIFAANKLCAWLIPTYRG
ncbi:MAG TPA: fatty acid hydroxylase, partial [Burkholderiaceae bacterium]|nr:fatty acid hydroxylase [Burkholderiaceae bacterium]